LDERFQQRERAGVYGSEGSAAASNVPGARETQMAWTDSSGNLWLFGGGGYDGTGTNGTLNDLWKYQVSGGVWTWMSGSVSQGAAVYGVYGALEIPASTNTPGDHALATPWVDEQGNLWLFGGDGDASQGYQGLLNDFLGIHALELDSKGTHINSSVASVAISNAEDITEPRV